MNPWFYNRACRPWNLQLGASLAVAHWIHLNKGQLYRELKAIVGTSYVTTAWDHSLRLSHSQIIERLKAS